MAKQLPKQSSWPDPLELLDLMDAIDVGQPQVILGGKLFNIFRKEGTLYWVAPTEGFTPCGYFDRKTSFVEVE